MKKTEVLWAEEAKKDLEEIVLYIARDSPEIAYKKFEELKLAADNLIDFPETGRIIPELQDQNIFAYREQIITPWRMMYKIEKGKIYILAVLDGRRNIEDILLKRQLR